LRIRKWSRTSGLICRSLAPPIAGGFPYGDGPVMGKQPKMAGAILFVVTAFGLCVACGFAGRFDLRRVEVKCW
jgi:hypothetical protein